MDRIPNDVRWTERPSRKRPKRCIEIGKDEEAGGGEKAGNSKKQSSRSLFPSPSHKQEELRKIYGRRTERNVKETSSSERKKPKRRVEIGKDEGAGGGEKAGNSKKQSSRSLFPSPSHSQEELRKIYGRRTERNVKETSSSEDSESSEEEEGISEEEFKKTEIWKQFKEALMMHTLSAKTQPKSSLPLAYSF
nr:uncharacterized protein LOC131779491 isoform X2 [Pocillopora verrucosa]